jgi:hypothetical protein
MRKEKNEEMTDPGSERDRDQMMLYGIVGDRLGQIKRRVPLDEPPPENIHLAVIGKPISRFDAIQKATGHAVPLPLPAVLVA